MSSLCGRFAPTPSGPLHFGSLVAAVASYLSVRSVRGRWLVRIEDVDRYRTAPGAADDIVRTLEGFGFTWDGDIVFQSQRSPIYAEILEELRRRGAVYDCACSRKEVGGGRLGVDGAPLYPGTCRNGVGPGREGRAVRLRTQGKSATFTDRLLGPLSQDVEEAVGDFVVFRADGIYAYHLAVVVDDHLQGVTEVVRGSDLVDSTARQILLHESLGWEIPSYCHIPVATLRSGEKLSKQTLAPAVKPTSEWMMRALCFLGHEPPAALRNAPPAELLAWGTAHWDLRRVPATRAICIEDLFS